MQLTTFGSMMVISSPSSSSSSDDSQWGSKERQQKQGGGQQQQLFISSRLGANAQRGAHYYNSAAAATAAAVPSIKPSLIGWIILSLSLSLSFLLFPRQLRPHHITSAKAPSVLSMFFFHSRLFLFRLSYIAYELEPRDRSSSRH